MEEDYMDQEYEVKRPSIFSRFFGFINAKFTKKSNRIELTSYSKFRDFLLEMDLDTDDPVYANAFQAAELCEEALRIARQRVTLVSKVKDVDEKSLELECFFNLNEEDAKSLSDLLDRFMSLTKERNILIYQLTDFDKSLNRMTDLESDAQGAMPQIQDAEKNQRILKHDIAQIEGEKAELEYQRGVLESSLKFIGRFTIAALGMFCFVTVFLGYLVMLQEVSIFYPTTVLILLVIVVVALVNIFKKRMRYELRVNGKKQQRAVELLNKKNVVYVYYTNFLAFEYKKYKVRNSQMLGNNLKDFNHYKHITTRIDAIRNIMYATEKEIGKFLRDKNLNYSKISIDQFAQTINVDDKIEYCRELAYEKNILEKNLDELDVQHEGIWNKLERANDQDVSEDKVIGQMIQIYFDDVNKLLTNIDKVEEAV